MQKDMPNKSKNYNWLDDVTSDDFKDEPKNMANKKAVRHPTAIYGVTAWIGIGTEIQEFFAFNELFEYITNPDNSISYYVTDDFIMDFKLDEYDDPDVVQGKQELAACELRERLLMHIVAERIAYYYKQEANIRGPNSNGIEAFFDLVTTKKINCDYLCEVCDVKFGSIKKVERDPFPERGRVRFKTIDGNKLVYRDAPAKPV